MVGTEGTETSPKHRGQARSKGTQTSRAWPMHHEANKHNKKDRGRTKRSSLGRLRDGAEQDGEMSNTQICGGLLRSTHPLWPLSYPAGLHLWSRA